MERRERINIFNSVFKGRIKKRKENWEKFGVINTLEKKVKK